MIHDGRNDGPVEKPGTAQSDARLDRQLGDLLGQLEIEEAPPSLTRRLYRIPLHAAGPDRWWQKLMATGQGPRWALVPALAAAVLVLGVVLTTMRQPSQEDLRQARQDLAVAFSYIERAGVVTGQEIQSAIGGELHRTVKENLSKHIPFTEQFRKEEST